MPQTSNWHLPSELPPTYSNKNHNALGLQIATYQVNCYPPTLKTTRPCWTSNCHLPTRWIATYSSSSSSSSSNYHLPSELLPTYSNRNHNGLDFKLPPTYQVNFYLLFFFFFKLPPTKWIATTYSNRNHNALDFKMPPTYPVDCYLLFLCFKLPPTKWIATPSKPQPPTYQVNCYLLLLLLGTYWSRYLLVLLFFFVFFLVLEEIHFSFFAYLPACWKSTTSKHVFLGGIAAREWAAATTMNACGFPPILVNSFNFFATDFGEDHMPVARKKGRKGKERKGGKEGRKDIICAFFWLIRQLHWLTDIKKCQKEFKRLPCLLQ